MQEEIFAPVLTMPLVHAAPPAGVAVGVGVGVAAPGGGVAVRVAVVGKKQSEPIGSLFCFLKKRLKIRHTADHLAKATIDVGDFASDAAGQVGQQERCCIAHVLNRHVATDWRGCFDFA